MLLRGAAEMARFFSDRAVFSKFLTSFLFLLILIYQNKIKMYSMYFLQDEK